MSLSSVCGRRICKVNGGKLKNLEVFLKNRFSKCCEDCDKKCRGDCCEKCNNCCSKKKMDEEQIDYIHIPDKDDGVFQQVPNSEPKQSDVVYICGRRGAGKSYYVSNYLKEYIKYFPKNKIFLFSQKKEDKQLDDLISKRVDIDRYIEEGGLMPDDFPTNCCVIFDDIDVLPNEKPDKLRTKIFNLMDSLIQLSRDKDITVIQTSHLATNHGETRNALNGSSSFTFFYGAISHQIKNALKTYYGLSKDNIKKVMDIKGSSYGTIHTTSPMVFQSEKECFILN